MANTTKRAQAVVTSSIEGGVLTLTFANGHTLNVDPSTLAAPIMAQAVLHGLKQKLCDAAAIGRNPLTGASATVQDKVDAVQAVYDRITRPDGTWNAIREGGDGTSAAANGLLLRALMEATNKDKATVTAFLDGKTKEEKAALRANGKVAAIIARLQSERVGVNTDDLLAELGGVSDEVEAVQEEAAPQEEPAPTAVKKGTRKPKAA